MGASTTKSPPAIGFLTVVEDPHGSLFGGYLLLSSAGRPLQFHCTAPIRANRAQQILYGPTLGDYLYGEQIGQALVRKATLDPAVVCTDEPRVLAVAEFCRCPVVLVEGCGTSQEATDGDSARLSGERMKRFELAGRRLAVGTAGENEAALRVRLAPFVEMIDLAEPFGRIRQAVEEARRGAA